MVNDFGVESVVCIEGVVQNNLLVVLSVIAAIFTYFHFRLLLEVYCGPQLYFLQSFDERSFSEMSITMSPSRNNNFYKLNDNSSRGGFDNLDGVYSPGRWTGTPRSGYFEPHPIVGEAWEALRRSLVNFRGEPVGTIGALDNSSEELNYDQVFIRDFVPSALAFMMNGESEIVNNFLLKTVFLQSRDKKGRQIQVRRRGNACKF